MTTAVIDDSPVGSTGLLESPTLAYRWRSFATSKPVPAALLAGLTGVHIASVLGFWLGGFGLRRLDWNTANGVVYLPKADALPQFLVGGFMHYLDGVLFAVIFAVTIFPRLPWKSTAHGNVLKGLAFGTGMSIIALGILTPLVYAPARGSEAGFFSMNFGWQYALSVFIFHWVYGAHVGLIYSPLDRDSKD